MHLVREKAGRFFVDLAVAFTGHRIGGPAKAGGVGSGFIGTRSGLSLINHLSRRLQH